MQIFSQHSAPKTYAGERIFRYSAFNSFIATFVAFSLFFGCLFLALEGGYRDATWNLPSAMLYLMAFIFFVFSLLALMNYRARSRPANWLVKAYPDRMLVKFRSYLNDHYPESDPAIVELAYTEIEWVRKTREKLTTPGCGADEGDRVQFFTFLDFKIKNADLSELEEAIRIERNRQPHMSEAGKWKRELFRARKRKAPDHEIAQIKANIKREKERQPKRRRGDGIKHHDYPVRVVDPGIVRVQWNGIRPKVPAALDFLSRHFPVEPELSLNTDTTQSNGDATAENHILDLASRGDIVEATRLVRQTYGYTLTRSREYVDELLKN